MVFGRRCGRLSHQLHINDLDFRNSAFYLVSILIFPVSQLPFQIDASPGLSKKRLPLILTKI